MSVSVTLILSVMETANLPTYQLPTYQRSNLPAILTKHSGDGVIIDLLLRTFSTFSQIILCGQFLVTLHRETTLENYKG